MVVEKGVIGFPIRSPFKGGFGEECMTARGVTPGFMDQQKSLP
jgi:hypothetical protein